MAQVRVTFLGTGSDQTREKDAVSVVFERENTGILIDAGPNIMKQLQNANLPPSSISCIIVSHQHGDHILGFPYFMFMDNVERRILKKLGERDLPVIAFREVYEFLVDATKFCYPGIDMASRIKFIEASETDFAKFEVRNATIIAAPIKHSVPTLGVRIEFPERSVAYLPDSMYCDNSVRLARDCDLVIHPAFCTSDIKEIATRFMHGTSEDAGKVAAESRSKRLALVDISRLVKNEQDLISDTKRFFGGEVFIPEELQTVTV